MKIRTDFVTNSSSSSFIVARKQSLTEAQKELIIKFVEDEMLGDLVATTKEELDKHFETYYDEDVDSDDFKNCYLYRYYEESLEAINKGMAVYRGRICFEGGDNGADMLDTLWYRLEKLDKDSFKGIDTSLNY